MEEYIESMEDRDGIRFNWNRWPQTRVEAAKVVLPLGCLFTPLKETQRDAAAPSSLQYEPVVCARPNCRSILNPYCQVCVLYANIIVLKLIGKIYLH